MSIERVDVDRCWSSPTPVGDSSTLIAASGICRFWNLMADFASKSFSVNAIHLFLLGYRSGNFFFSFSFLFPTSSSALCFIHLQYQYPKAQPIQEPMKVRSDHSHCQTAVGQPGIGKRQRVSTKSETSFSNSKIGTPSSTHNPTRAGVASKK